MVVTIWTFESILAPFRGVDHFQRGFEIVHVFIVGYLSYTANKTSIIEIRIRNSRVFNSSDLKRPEAVQIADKKKKQNKRKQIFFSKTLVNCLGTHLAKPCYLASAYWASLSASVLCTGLLLVLSCVLLWFDPPESGLFRILSYKNKKKYFFSPKFFGDVCILFSSSHLYLLFFFPVNLLKAISSHNILIVRNLDKACGCYISLVIFVVNQIFSKNK